MAAVTPAKWAAPPAAAIITSIPFSVEEVTHLCNSSGVRWAEITFAS